jgi:tetratricopeptide (TPR) repeat protein
MVKLLLLAAAFTTEGAQQDWIDQLGAADRLVRENRHHEAETAYTRASKQAEKLGADQLPMAVTLNHMGHQYQILGRLREAERVNAAALAIVERRLGTASPDAVRVALDLSTVYLELGEVSKTESLMRRFLRGSNELSAADRATLLAELASVMACKQQFEEAEALYRAALAVFERDPTPEFRERTIIGQSNLSTIYMRIGRFSEGRSYSDRAQALLRMMTNPPPLLVLKTLASAAAVSALTGKSEEADSLFRFVISHCEDNFGPDYYLMGYVMDSYAEFLRRAGRRKDARTAQNRANAILNSFGKENLIGLTVDARTFR